MADWKPPDKAIGWAPPDKPAGAAPTATPPVAADDEAQPGLVSRVIGAHPVGSLLRDVVPPLANMAVADPIRAGAADITALARRGLDPDPAKFNELREQSLAGTSGLRLPETEAGQSIRGVLSKPGEWLASGVQGASNLLLGPETTAKLGPAATIAGDVLPLAGGFASAMRGRGAPIEAVQAAKAENRGRKSLSEGFQSGLYEGGGSALDVVEEMQKARAAGQPMALLDVNNPELRSRIGTTYRQGGAAQSRISDFLEGRHREQVPRAEGIIGEGLGDANTFRQTADTLKEQRSTHARPLFEAASEGPGLKALQYEFTQANAVAGRDAAMAAQRLTQAEAAMTQAAARSSTAGNVYSSSGAATDTATAQAGVAAARQELAQAQARKQQIFDLMRQAQQDGTWRPDATWSPYLELLRTDNPNIRRGIATGWDIERNKAHAAGQQPNPRDYAITGFDEAGRPIVGAVPNMKLWMVAKEGLDAQIDARISKKQGAVDKKAHSLILLRDGLVAELDRLNPQYRVAREMWQGDSASSTALLRGEKLFDKKAFKTDADLKAYLDGLSASDREFVKLGLAQHLMDAVRRAPDAADKAKRVVNTDLARDRMGMLLGADAERFLAAVEREADMEKSRQYYKGGSPTAARRAEDVRNERKVDAGAGMVSSLFHGRFLEAARAANRLRRAMSSGPDAAANEAVSRLVTDPNIAAQTSGPLLPPIAVPKRYMMTPGRALAAGEVAQPHEDDPVMRAFGR